MIYLLFCACWLIACQDLSKGDLKNNLPQQMASMRSQGDSLPPRPQVQRWLKAEGIPADVGIYQFEGFAPWIAEPAPDNDTLYVFNFWATWCGPCVAELPYFERLRQNTQGQKIRIILVSLDFVKELDKKLIPFLRRRQLSNEVLVLDQDGVNEWMERIDPEWSGSIPATLMIQGKKRRFYERVFKHEELESTVSEFLNQN